MFPDPQEKFSRFTLRGQWIIGKMLVMIDSPQVKLGGCCILSEGN